jgi:hypothetical protein
MEIRIDSNLELSTDAAGCRPICFVPEVDLFGLEEECIVDAF